MRCRTPGKNTPLKRPMSALSLRNNDPEQNDRKMAAERDKASLARFNYASELFYVCRDYELMLANALCTTASEVCTNLVQMWPECTFVRFRVSLR